MLLRDNRPLTSPVVDFFGGGRLFRNIHPFIESEGIATGTVYDDFGLHGEKWDPDTYLARSKRPPMLFCIGYDESTPHRLRQRGIRFNELKQQGVIFATYVAPGVIVGPGTSIGNGSVIHLGTIIHARVTIGDCVFLNIGSVVSHDALIGHNIFFGPGVTVSGNVTIGSGTFAGTGAIIINEITIGETVTIAAGAVVTKDVPTCTMMAGVPAMIKKYFKE